MAEYIEREAAIDAIIKVYVRTVGYKARERVFKAEEAVYRLPAADVALVVRCKYCKYLVSVNANGKGIPTCQLSGMEVAPVDYCSCAGRA